MECVICAARLEGGHEDHAAGAAGAGAEAGRAGSDPGRRAERRRLRSRARGSCSSSSSASAAPSFDAFLRGYFDHFAFQSIPTARVRRVREAEPAARSIRARSPTPNSTPGCTSRASRTFAPRTLSPRLGVVDSARLAWLGSAQLPPPVDHRAVDDAGVGALPRRHAGDAEARTACRSSTPPIASPARPTARSRSAGIRWPCAAATCRRNPAIAEFLQKIGRRKLIMPTYEALVERPRPGWHSRRKCSRRRSRATTRSPPRRWRR